MCATRIKPIFPGNKVWARYLSGKTKNQNWSRCIPTSWQRLLFASVGASCKEPAQHGTHILHNILPTFLQFVVWLTWCYMPGVREWKRHLVRKPSIQSSVCIDFGPLAFMSRKRAWVCTVFDLPASDWWLVTFPPVVGSNVFNLYFIDGTTRNWTRICCT